MDSTWESKSENESKRDEGWGELLSLPHVAVKTYIIDYNYWNNEGYNDRCAQYGVAREEAHILHVVW